ncbi:MAG: HEAT repeat domain-containing protein [Gammaproteobacteria bacterium]|nr:HEAT repeat domain-containing protein [Gammaproteobacteria bacterium]
MSLLSGFQAGRAINTLLADDAGASAEGKRALYRLKQIGEPAIPRLIEALGSPQNTATLEQLLIGFVRNSTLHAFVVGLSAGDQRIVDGVTRILKRSKEFNPNDLLPYFSQPIGEAEVSKTALGEILTSHAERINPTTLLGLLDHVDSKVRPMLYRLLDTIATEALVPDLIQRLDSPQTLVRTHLLNLLARFDTAASREGLVKGLGDSNKSVRQAALNGLATLQATEHVADICQLLSDPDLTVQSAAIETLAKIQSPDTVKHLITVLQDESEYVRRAAVEVLNEVGDQNAVKDLLNALRDVDWWVKVRAADALGAIGGPKVFDAVLALIKDKDEFLRRTAVEILNTGKDPRALDRLIEALRDEDWWVRERAVDALAAIGDARAVPHLITMLEENPEAGQVVIRALATLGDRQAINPLLRQLDKADNTLRKEALKALESLTDDTSAQAVQEAVTQLIHTRGDEVGSAADETVRSLIQRFGDRASPASRGASAVAPPVARPSTEVMDLPTQAFDSRAPQPDSSGQTQSMPLDATRATDSETTPLTHYLDPSRLVPNTILAERYHVIRKIGEGAFGVVWLVEDVMVGDEFILKFLNPQFAADQNMIERFMHELRYARKITHENIIRIYDLVTVGDSYAISMEYFPSHSLADELREHKTRHTTFDLPRGIHVISCICRGMAQAQAQAVVHRDLKPANILIDENDELKIVDFGLAAAARKADSRLTKSGILVGTPTYMAPEQVRGRTIDSRTDIYTLGIIMYEMFAGQAPYTGDESMAILFQHVEGKAIPPREINADIPPALEQVIIKAMAVDPEQRFQTFDALRLQLETICKDAC